MAVFDSGTTQAIDSGMMPAADAGFAADAMAMNSLCPPSGPFGAFETNIAPDITLQDCDGNIFSLHDLCQKRAAWMFTLAGW